MQKVGIIGDYIHPLEALSQEIERREIMVIDGVTMMPKYHEPFVYPHVVIALCHQGRVRLSYDMKPIQDFLPHDISVCYPGHFLTTHETSDDYRATLLVISQKCHETLHHRLTYGKNMVYHRNPTFHLSDEHYACMQHIIKLMRDAGNLSIPRRKDILVSALDLFSLMIDEFRKSALEDNADSNLFNQFFDAIVEHYKENREVNYYAQLLCLSPKYFGNIIKQETGMSAGYWISHYVTTQAKMMLRSRRDLSIQQIGDDLGFDKQAIFSRYFKQQYRSIEAIFLTSLAKKTKIRNLYRVADFFRYRIVYDTMVIGS